MAEAKKKPDTGEEEAEAPKKKSKLMLIIIIAVVAVALIGGGATFFLMKKKAAAAADEEGDEAPAKEERAKKASKAHSDAPPVFVKLEAFTVKLQSEGQDAYLQAIPELRVLDAHTGDRIKQYNAEIRHKVLLILAGKKASELSTPQGMQQLSNEMRVTINGILEPPTPRKKGSKEPEAPGDTAGPDDPVQSVLFTSFIVQ